MKKSNANIYYTYLFIFFLLITSCKKSDPQPDDSLKSLVVTPNTVLNDNILLGNPSKATSNIDSANNYLIQKTQYSLSYNNSKGTPNWVSWHLSLSSLGNTARQDDFRADTSLPSKFYHVTDADFIGSGFDRGHMCPSGDRTNSVNNNSATFLMSNMVPQAPNNNQITWEDLESYCRSLVYAGNDLYIIDGPNGIGGSGSKGSTTYSLSGGRITVPATLWKVIVVLKTGSADIDHVNANTRVIAVSTPNKQSVNSQNWGYYRVSIDQLETLTGYDFLSNVPASIQAIIEAKIDSGPIM